MMISMVCATHAYFVYNFTMEFMKYKTIYFTDDDVFHTKDIYEYIKYTSKQFLYNKEYGKRVGYIQVTSHPFEL